MDLYRVLIDLSRFVMYFSLCDPKVVLMLDLREIPRASLSDV